MYTNVKILSGDINANRLCDNLTFIYGGIMHNFDKTAKQWRDDYNKWNNDIDKNPYIKCHCCNVDFDDNKPVYVGFFYIEDSNELTKLQTVCHDCALRLSTKILDANGDEEKSLKITKEMIQKGHAVHKLKLDATYTKSSKKLEVSAFPNLHTVWFSIDENIEDMSYNEQIEFVLNDLMPKNKKMYDSFHAVLSAEIN